MKKIIIYIFLSISLLQAANCKNKTFSLNSYELQGLTIMDLVQDLTRQCDISVIFTDERSKQRLNQDLGFVSIKDYSLNELFKFLFSQRNLFYEYNRHKGVLKLSYYKMKNFNVNYINASELTTKSTKSITVGAGRSDKSAQGSSNSDKTQVTLTSTFTFWEKLKEHIENILKTDENYDANINKILINRDAAIVSITGTKRQLNEIEDYLNVIQKRMHLQVMLSAFVIELNYKDEKNTGIDWSKFQLKLDPKFSFFDKSKRNSNSNWSFAANFDPKGVIDFLNGYGNVEIVSNPKVLTLNNQPAIINVGEQLNYRFLSGGSSNAGTSASSETYEIGSIFVGLTLSIIPEVTENGDIIMRINPITSKLLHQEAFDKNQAARVIPPDTKVKQMSSIVKVKDGQKVLIGGLVERSKENKNTKVPLLGDIPLLGKLFSHKGHTISKKELFVIITPTLIKNEKFPSLDDAVKTRLY